MNDLKELWKAESDGTDMLGQMLQNRLFKQSGFKTPLAKLKRNLAIHLIYAVLITLGYALLIYFFPIWQVQLCMLLLIAFNLWAMAKAYHLYRNIDLNISSHTVLEELKKHHHAFSEWQKQNMRVALFVYPFAATGGFMLGGTVGSGKPVEVFMNDQRILLALLIVLIILVPLCYLVAKWMNKIAFGKYIDQLQERIKELEAEG